MKYSITQIWDFLLEVVFPRSGIAQNLEKMGADEVLAKLPLCGMIESGIVGGGDVGDVGGVGGDVGGVGGVVGGIFAVFRYRNVMARRMIWELKYRGNKKVARLCAEVLYKTILELENFFESNRVGQNLEVILIPVPLTRARRRERGFNQNEIVIEEIMKIVSEESFVGERIFSFSFDALVKVRNTAPQSSIKNRAERLKNLAGCFSVPIPELVRGKNIILIDDVATTGSTLAEAHTALLQAGALSVRAIAIAH